jgi:propanediol dehydratase small subunit
MTTDSILYCPKCGAKEYVYLKNDIIIKIPAALLDGEGARETLKNANQELQQLWYAPICDYYPEETVQHSNS